jgi:hypothetical protein
VVKPWSIPLLWHGATVAVLASGPSMSQTAADNVRAAGLHAIVINTTFKLAPWADILYAADAAWWQHTPGAFEFAGLKVSCEAVQGALTMQRAKEIVGYTDDPGCVHSLGHSGAQAIQIAAKAGARRILVLGMDMDGSHWHGQHPAPLRNTHSDQFQIWCDRMQTLARALEARGVDVINCSQVSRLTCWPKVPLEEALARTEHAA